MARRRKYQFITDPILKASVVIESFVSKAKKEVSDWAGKYKSEIANYTADENRQTVAATKLAGFYMGITEPDVRNAIREAVSRAKARQTEVVGAVLGRLPTPVVPAEARTTAKKVAELIGAPVPAV
jgi:hypothetical protein